MKRREFITLLGGAAAAWPLAARGQPRVPRIGLLATGSQAAWVQWTDAFAQRLHELGWIDGSTVAIDYRWGEGIPQRYTDAIADFVRAKVDVIVTGAGAVNVAKNATSTIPIVFALAPDPLGSGMVASLQRPGGNITGLSIQNTDLAGKRTELLREIVPGLKRLAVMANADYPGTELELTEVSAAAGKLGIDVIHLPIRRGDDIAPAIAALKGQADALYVYAEPLVNSHRAGIATQARDAKLPTGFSFREYIQDGGLLSYGPNIADLFRRAGDYVDKILRGTKPADIPVEQPTKFSLVVNLTTAKALGLTLTEAFLLRADEVIE